MSADLLVGLDLGTSAIKGVLVSTRGEILATGNRPTELLYPGRNRVEFNPVRYYDLVCSVIRALKAKAPKHGSIKAICLSGATGSTLLLDACGKPLCNAISWMDSRAGHDYRKLLPELRPNDVYRIVGWPWLESFPLTQLAWLQKSRKGLYRRARYRVLDITYVLFRMTGQLAMDPSTATLSYLQNQVKQRWHAPFLRALSIEERFLPHLKPSGSLAGPLSDEASKKAGLPKATPVVLGAFDHPSAARGTGVFDPGQMLLSCGTSWVGFYPIANRQKALSQGMLVDPFLRPGGPWGALFSLTRIGAAIDDYVNALFARTKSKSKYLRFSEEAFLAPLGANGLLINPMLRPLPGRMAYLMKLHAPSDIARAIMEGTAFELKKRMSALAKAGIAANQTTMVGGPSESPAWPKIVADVLGIKVTLRNGQNAGALGAAILAGVGAGIFKDERKGFAAIGGPGKAIAPNRKAHAKYEELFSAYAKKSYVPFFSPRMRP